MSENHFTQNIIIINSTIIEISKTIIIKSHYLFIDKVISRDRVFGDKNVGCIVLGSKYQWEM